MMFMAYWFMAMLGIPILIVVFLEWRSNIGYRKAVADGKPQYKIYKYWSDSKAKHMYRLSELGGFGNYHASNQCGDLRWAKRIAKHYNIKLEEEE